MGFLGSTKWSHPDCFPLARAGVLSRLPICGAREGPGSRGLDPTSQPVRKYNLHKYIYIVIHTLCITKSYVMYAFGIMYIMCIYIIYILCVYIYLHIMLTQTEATKLYCERSPERRISQGLSRFNMINPFPRVWKTPTRKHFFVGYGLCIYTFWGH